MFSFVSVKRNDDDWRICIIAWNSMDMITMNEFCNKTNINSDEIKTKLIKDYEGYLCNAGIKFKSRTYADRAIEEVLQPNITAFILSEKYKSVERERA